MGKLTSQQEAELIRDRIHAQERRLNQIVMEQDLLDKEAHEVEMMIHALKVDLWDLEFEIQDAHEGC